MNTEAWLAMMVKMMMMLQLYIQTYKMYVIALPFSSESRDYALKQIEGTGISMSACREIAVSSPLSTSVFFEKLFDEQALQASTLVIFTSPP